MKKPNPQAAHLGKGALRRRPGAVRGRRDIPPGERRGGAVELDIEPLDAVKLPSAAAEPDAPQLHDDVPGNVRLDFL